MTRTLLETFPIWLLAILVIGGTVALAVGGLLLVRRRLPELQENAVNEIAGIVIGVLAAVFGIILGFVTVSLYESYSDAKATVQQEATQVIELFNDTRSFPKAPAAKVEHEIKAYLAAVRFREWNEMAHGRADQRVGRKHIGDLYSALQAYEPRSESQIAFYRDAIDRLNGIVNARRARLNEATETLPAAFWAMLVVGTVLLICSLYLLGVSNRRLHTVLVVAVATLTSFNLLVVVALDYPFSGDISVSNEAFDTGQLQLLHVTRADLEGS
jgi:heme/copper-type cytochrome/quinol oxidase subunit 1